MIGLSALATNPIALLITCGILIGLNFPLGKLAGEASISPILWSLLVSASAMATLLPLVLARGGLAIPRGTVANYAVVSGIITFVAANLLVFAVIPKVGAGYTGLMFALSPVFTLTLSILFRFKPPNVLGLIGIAVGFLGAALVTLSRQAGTPEETSHTIWYAAALAIPMTLAAGNVYRTLAWPEGTSPDVLAFWSHGVAALVFLVLLLIFEQGLPLTDLVLAPAASIIQALVAGATFLVYFRLQKYGGPVLLSQMGYIGAAVGLAAGTLFLGETYRLLTWIGAGVIAIGIAFTIISQRQTAVTDT